MPTRRRRLTRKPRGFWHRHETAVAALVLAAAIVGLALMPVSHTCVIGDMRARYDARVPPELHDVYSDAGRMQLGFGAAAVGDWEGLGDALAVNGFVFVRHTNRASPRYYGLAVNRTFQTNAFVYVPPERAPNAYYRVETAARIDRLLEQLARNYPEGVIAGGLLRFAPLRSIAMSAPAIAGVPVARHAARYYTRPMEAVNESWAYVVLIAARDADERLRTILPPAAARTTGAGQALALRLRDVPDADSVTTISDKAISVGQLLKDAVATQGQLALYAITQPSACDGASQRNSD